LNTYLFRAQRYAELTCFAIVNSFLFYRNEWGLTFCAYVLSKLYPLVAGLRGGIYFQKPMSDDVQAVCTQVYVSYGLFGGRGGSLFATDGIHSFFLDAGKMS